MARYIGNFKIGVYDTPSDVSSAAAQAIVKWARTCARRRGGFTIALSGGSTPKETYRLLAAAPSAGQMPWPATQVYFGDERHVPANHPDSNYRMACEALLNAAPIPACNIFPVPTSDKDASRCAAAYERILRRNFIPGRTGFPVFDLVLLGLGPDGHVASLFPHIPALRERRRWVARSNPRPTSPAIKPGVDRITLTAPVIQHAAAVFVLATGEEKAPVLAKVFAARRPVAALPARILWQCRGRVGFFLDKKIFSL